MDELSIKRGFGKVINTHGYGFHYSVLRLAHGLADRNASQWAFVAAEFPVQVQGEGTRIDFVLRLRHSPIYLLAECKRANPALSNWCFARAPYVRRNRTTEPLFLECAEHDEDGFLYAAARRGLRQEDAYHVALEVKSDKKGDPYGAGRGAIEEAATQICRGLNGMIEFVAANGRILSSQMNAYFLPVIFTTARIWASDVDLASADVENGNIDFSEYSLAEKPWVFYQYHLSPGIKHSYSPAERPSAMGDLLDSLYVRTIAIVAASGIESFLRWSSDPDYYLA